MAKHADKVIIVNRTALVGKYGAAGYAKISAALTDMIAADRARTVSTRLVAIDRASTMKSLGAPVVTSVADGPAVKAAIDAVSKATTAHYVMLLGAPDVLPQQLLRNPTTDEDPVVPSDLPYACSSPSSADPATFVGPTRVVGRLPDLLGESDPAYLVRLIKAATRWKPRRAADYTSVFALTTDTWKVSTRMSVERLAGSSNPVHISPPAGPGWTAAQLRARTHFVNCHGGDTDPSWFGERHGVAALPIAHTAANLPRRITAGTVVAAECCFGAQHYPPALANGQSGLAATYLYEGAIGVLGASTLAYGPEDDMGAADLITRYFLTAVVDGASLGRALLSARLRFVQELGELDPIDLKTLAQFDLLGDPSVNPVRKVPPKGSPKGGLRAATGARRATMFGVGVALDSVVTRASSSPARMQRTRVEAVATGMGVSIDPIAQVSTYLASPLVPSRARFHLIQENETMTVIREEPGLPPSVRTVVRK